MEIRGTLKSGQQVIDRTDVPSHLHPEVALLLQEALALIDVGGNEFYRTAVDLGRVIGTDRCVQTGAGDRIAYAQRAGRNGQTRFVIGKEPAPTQLVSVVLLQSDEDPDVFELITAFVGQLAPREPWDPAATEEDKQFWETHALTWDPGEKLDS